jgi:hypothetical protein
MPAEEETYLAFLLRLRRESRAGPWRATLANPHTGERHNFARLEQLYQFLDERLAQMGDADTDEGQNQPADPSAKVM